MIIAQAMCQESLSKFQLVLILLYHYWGSSVVVPTATTLKAFASEICSDLDEAGSVVTLRHTSDFLSIPYIIWVSGEFLFVFIKTSLQSWHSQAKRMLVNIKEMGGRDLLHTELSQYLEGLSNMTIFLWGKTENNGLLYFKILAALETPVLCLYLTESRFPSSFTLASLTVGEWRWQCHCDIDCLASALFLLFEAAHCLSYSHTKCHIRLGYGIEEPCHFLLNSFLQCQFFVEMFWGFNAQSSPNTLRLPSCPSKPSALQLLLSLCHQWVHLSSKPARRRVSGASCILTVFPGLEHCVSFLLLVLDLWA